MRLLIAVVLSATIVAGGTPQDTAAGADSWPHFRGSRHLTGVSTSEVSTELSLAWEFDTGEMIDSSAAIVDGTVYVGSQAGELHAVDLATGEPVWKYTTVDPIGESSPAVSGGVVYIGDLGGRVHAVDAATGEGIWTFETESEIKASPVVEDGKVLIGSYDLYLYAIDAATGELAWKVPTDGPVHATVVVRDGVVYSTGCDGFLRALRIEDGTEVFSFDAGAYTGASPALEGDRLYFGTFANEVLAVDISERRAIWQYLPRRQFPFYSSPAIADGRVVVGGRDKVVHALDTETGESAWTFEARSRVDSSPAISGGRVYVGSHDGRLYVLDLASGEKLWEFEAGGALAASPAIADGYVVIGSADGRLYALR